MATSTQINALTALYVGYFDRAPDPAGLQFWIDQIDGGREFNTIAADFAASAEAEALYPYLTTPDVSTPSTFVQNIYLNLFGRTAEPEGLEFWTGVLEAGSVTVADFIEAIINGAVDAPTATPPTFDKAVLDNKVEVGLDFATDAGNAPGFEFDEAAKSAAVSAVNGVTEDEATVVAAKAATDAFVGGVANVGDTFTLTTGADDINGTADNDTINALTVNATGANATTLSAFDDIDGGAGKDTLNIYSNGSAAAAPIDENNGVPSTATIKNVEIVNVFNADATDAGDFGDASKFSGVEQLWQVNAAANVTNLAATTTAGFKGTAQTLSVTAAATAASASIALSEVVEAGAAAGANDVSLAVAGDAVATVNVSGTLKDGLDAAKTENLNLSVTAGENLTSVAINSAVATTVALTEDANTTTAKTLTELDASGSTGAITTAGTATDTGAASYALQTIKTGTGNDNVTIDTTTVKDNAATAADETVTGTVMTGEGDDKVTVTTDGTGITSVSTGAGNDTVAVTTRGTTLNVDMGEGDDTFTSAVAITSVDTIDAGAGTDTLLLSLVGAANVGAFSNFDVYDVAGMSNNLDLNILNTNNTVTEIVGSAALGGAVTLQNVSTDFRATGDMVFADNATVDADEVLTLQQATAAALTVTLDADQTVAGAGDDVAGMAIAAANATSVSAVFDADYLAVAGSEAGETASTDNQSTISLSTVAATSATVVSGGANATNNLNLSDDNGVGTAGVLTSLSITGSQDINVAYTADTNGTVLSTVDASALTGDLSISLANLADGATVTLGSGQDAITVTDASNATGIESIVGFEKTAAVAVSTVVGDAAAKAAAIADADVIDLGSAAVADNTLVAGAAGATVADGVLTFTGAGPGTLADAIAIADLYAETLGEAVLFEYLGDSFVFEQGATHAGGGAEAVTAADTVVELSGITGVTNFAENAATDQFFIV